MRSDFGVLILTHGRANHVKTVSTMLRCGYAGKYFIVIDNEDEQEDEYRRIYGDKVVMFDKLAESKETDTMDIQGNRKCVVHARNAAFKIAEQLGLKYFIVLDDDYNAFNYRFVVDGALLSRPIRNLDAVWEAMAEFLDASGALTFAMAQGGDYLGGTHSTVWRKQITRKAMNSFVCKTDRPFKFFGRINEDVNAYVANAQIGKLMFTTGLVMLNQEVTQRAAGGLTDIYLQVGTYVKSFYSVIAAPSAVKVSVMGGNDHRVHHKVKWENCEVKIVSSRYRKE